MAKHDELRAYLVEALPELVRNPEALLVYLTGGRLCARHGANLGFEYRASLAIDVLGFPGEPAQFFLPLLLWVRRYMPATLLNHDTADNAIAFEIDILDSGAVDISVKLPMSEAVDVTLQEGGDYQMTLRDEPIFPDDGLLIDPVALLKRIFNQAGELIVGTPLP